jgi:hypothetical protein
MQPADFFRAAARQPERFAILHYSSEGLYDSGGLASASPRITSIAAMELESRRITSFAPHAIAEELAVTDENSCPRMDDIERVMIDRLHAFLALHRDRYVIHWNMRDLVFGFGHLEHRDLVLGGAGLALVPEEQRIDLHAILKQRYGPSFAPVPRLPGLMQLNGFRRDVVLGGPEEAQAFRCGDYIRMHRSTISKVEFMAHAISLAGKRRLKTQGAGVVARLDRMLDSRAARMTSLTSSCLGVGAIISRFIF